MLFESNGHVVREQRLWCYRVTDLVNRTEARSELSVRLGAMGHADAWMLHGCYVGV
jgi:hypothetical protein